MSKDELLSELFTLTADQYQKWIFALGNALTVSARDTYVPGELAGDAVQLIGFNELQHQIYGRLSAFESQHEWTTESFVDGLVEKAKTYKIDGGLGWAIKHSLDQLRRSSRS